MKKMSEKKRTSSHVTNEREYVKRARKAMSYRSKKQAARTLDEYTGGFVDLKNDRECISRGDLHRICESGVIFPVKYDTKLEAYYRGRKHLEKGMNQRHACAVCDRGFSEEHLRKCTPMGKTAERWRGKLGGSDEVPRALREYYSVAEFLPELEGALLSRRAVIRPSMGKLQASIFVCHHCYDSMRSGKTPPKFSVANGFDIGELPEELHSARSIEKRLTSLTNVAHSVAVLRGGKHKTLKGHVSVMRMNASAIQHKLPKLLSKEDESFLVVFAGALTPAQKIAAMKRHEARVSIVRELLQFFLEHNPLYHQNNVTIDNEELKKLEQNGGDAGVTYETIGSLNDTCDERNEHDIMNQTSPIGVSLSKSAPSICSEDNTTNKEMSVENEDTYCETTGIYVEAEPQTSVEALKEAQKTILVRNRGSFISYYDKDLLALSFPDLFPYGRGHPGTSRIISVSFEECCRYYLSLANRRFAQHHSFLLISFDLCGRQRVVKSTCVRSFCRPEEYEELAKVTRDDLSEALHEKKKNRERALSGRPREKKAETVAEKLLRQVKISQSSMWGSAEERLIYRRQAFSMDAYFKSGAIFVTITPSETGTLCIAAIAGRVCLDSIRRLEDGQLPVRAERAAIAGSDPVACAQYFELICDIFIEDLVGFNKSNSLSYKGGGIFGTVKAFLGVVEAQTSGTLHLHAILFIAGLPRTVKEFVTKCEDDASGGIFKNSVCGLVDSVISATVPYSATVGEDHQCPACHGKQCLDTYDKVPEGAFWKQPRRNKPIPLSKCQICDKEFGGSEVIRHQVKRLRDSLLNIASADARLIPFGQSHPETDHLTELYCLKERHHIWPPVGESTQSELFRLHRFLLSRIVLLTQQHSHLHVDSCFKASVSCKEGHYRYGFPRRGGCETYIDKDFCLILGRDHHNEYINSFNDVISLLFRTNHDIRFLLGGTTDALYYVMKYVTKGPAFNSGLEKAVMESYDRRRRVEIKDSISDDPISRIKTGRARVNSMATAVSRMQEIPSPLCALYMRRKTALYSSHEFGKLLLGQFMAIIRSERHESELIEKNDGKIAIATQYHDYACRSAELESLCVMDFVAWYRRARVKKNANSEMKQAVTDIVEKSSHLESEVYGFQRQHPLNRTHGLRRRKTDVIPDLIGPRFPDKDKLNTAEERENYGLMGLILFFPFRLHTDLMQGTESYWKSFQLLYNSKNISKQARDILENFQEYYVSKNAAAQERKALWEAKALYTEEDAMNSEKSQNSEEDMSDLFQIEKGLHSVSEWDFHNFVLLRGNAEKSFETVAHISNHPNTRACIGFSAVASLRHRHGKEVSSGDPRDVESKFAFDTKNVKQMYKNVCLERDDAILTENGTDCEQNWSNEKCNHGNEDTTTVVFLDEALQQLTNRNASELSGNTEAASSKHRSDCGHFASFDSVTELFSLNSLQKKAFSLVAKELLFRLAEGYSLSGFMKSRNRKRKKFTMYLGGEGGTGKTRVIEALLHFCKSWGIPRAIRTCAPTGIAASFVHGRTIHSLLGISAGSSFNPKKRIPRNVYELHEDTMLLIIDEVSMLNRKILATLDVFFKKVKECDLPFGGIMVMLCGDFFQIPPVANDPLYINPSLSNRRVGIQDTIGFEIWRNLDYAIVLKRNMRQSEDEAFNQCLSRVRYGRTTKDDLTLLNTRVVEPHLLQHFRGAHNSQIPFVVRTNDLRTMLNWKMLQARQKAVQEKPIVCIAQIQALNGNGICLEDMETILDANDTDTGNLAVVLPMICGMPIRITQNIFVELGVANGTEGFVEGVAFPSSTSFQSVKLFGVDCLVSDKLPDTAFVRSSSFRQKMRRRFPNLPSRYSDETIPISPTKVENISSLLKRKLRTTTKLTFKQLPFVPSYASTTYKVQGSTADGIVVFALMKECRANPPKASLYVVLSRVRKLENLLLIEKLTEVDSKFFIPSEELLAEDKRLRALHQMTLALIDKESDI